MFIFFCNLKFKIKQIVLTILLMIVSYYVDSQSINEESVLDSIIKKNTFEIYVTYEGDISEQFIEFENYVQKIDENKLIKLLDNNNLVIKCYAFYFLAKSNNKYCFEYFLKNIEEKEELLFRFKNVSFYMPFNEFLADLVLNDDFHFPEIKYNLSLHQQERLVKVYRKKNSLILTYKWNWIEDLPITRGNYSVISKSYKKTKNINLLYVLFKYKKKRLKKQIKQQLKVDDILYKEEFYYYTDKQIFEIAKMYGLEHFIKELQSIYKELLNTSKYEKYFLTSATTDFYTSILNTPQKIDEISKMIRSQLNNMETKLYYQHKRIIGDVLKSYKTPYYQDDFFN